ERYFDVVLFSTFIDVAVFRALAPSVPGWNGRCRYLSYFHENQFCYPSYLDQPPNHQFTAINFTTALASDQIAFNSEFNRRSFFSGSNTYLVKAADMEMADCLKDLEKKSCVLYPGIDFSGIDQAPRKNKTERSKLIVWNHRWEHDKNPEEFFETLYQLSDAGIEFRLCVLGENFRNRPACFDEAQDRLNERIVHWGYIHDRKRYYRRLVEGDIVVSTAMHEFFGMSVIEAVRAGCRPVLPRRLSYPELFAEAYLYDQKDLGSHLKALLEGDVGFNRDRGVAITEPYDWVSRADDFRLWLT
ncbi:MAG: DUF3524 domain-containing protein, partial [Desulfofustis sp.]